MKKRLLLIICIIVSSLFILAGCSGNNSKTSAATSSEKETKKEAEVIMNGITWDDKMKEEFKSIYHLDPIPGNYWYDAKCGLWGQMGGPALSFIRAGHAYGELKSDASNGNSGIFINGREIPVEEREIWSLVMGTPAQQGRYWLDAYGNVGYEGYPVVVFNLILLARQNSYRAKGGSDNFWSSSLARGNEENGFGYVSIPGSGITVSYGN